MAEKAKQFLFVFDFDLTIIDRNTDGEVIRLHRGLKNSVSSDEYFKDKVGWSTEMSYTLKKLTESNVPKDKIDEVILDIPLTEGFVDVFNVLKENQGKHDSFILSHSNKYFIDILLERLDLKSVFNDIYTYDCEWTNTDTQLVVKPYDDPPNSCEICPNDFCKGSCIRGIIKSWKDSMYTTKKNSSCETVVVYVGDGSADYCAALQLTKADYVLVRRGFRLEKRIQNGKDSLKAKWILWDSGCEVAKSLTEIMGT